MTIQFDPRRRLESFQQEDWEALQKVLDHCWEVYNGRVTLSYASAYAIPWPQEKLMAALGCMGEDGHAKLYLKIYHTCEQHPVDCIPLKETGTLLYPYLCPDCEQEAEKEDLSFDVEAVITKKVKVC